MSDSISHWTNRGVFSIEVESPRKVDLYVLKFNGEVLFRYTSLKEAAASISLGKWVEKLGFSASSLGVPALLNDWNRLR